MPDASPSLSLEEFAYRALREMVLRGRFKPGEKLVQEELAAAIGVSRTPLRSAIANLARDHLLELTPRGEAYALELTPERIAAMFEVRAVLEGLICRLVAPGIERKHLAYLRSLITTAPTDSDEESLAAYRAADVEFHTFLAGLVSDRFVSRVLEPLQVVLDSSLAQGLLRAPAETLPEHLAIIDALEAHDADAAEAAMLIHIRRTVAALHDGSAPGPAKQEPK